jgi:MSHA pilin protein MshC
MGSRRPPRSHGFTLIELVIVIVLTGILGAVAASRLLTPQGFASRGFYDEAQAVVRFAQKTAIAWRRTILVCVSATEVSAISSNDCSAPTPTYVPHPVNPVNPLKTQAAPSGVTLTSTSGSSFSFDGLGRPSAATTITLNSTNTDDPARVIIVATETGYVYH